MRTGKGEAEPARLKGGQPPVQPSDTRLGRASGTGAQDCGLQRGEQRLRQNGETERAGQCRPVPTFLRPHSGLIGSQVSLKLRAST